MLACLLCWQTLFVLRTSLLMLTRMPVSKHAWLACAAPYFICLCLHVVFADHAPACCAPCSFLPCPNASSCNACLRSCRPLFMWLACQYLVCGLMLFEACLHGLAAPYADKRADPTHNVARCGSVGLPCAVAQRAACGGMGTARQQQQRATAPMRRRAGHLQRPTRTW